MTIFDASTIFKIYILHVWAGLERFSYQTSMRQLLSLLLIVKKNCKTVKNERGRLRSTSSTLIAGILQLI